MSGILDSKSRVLDTIITLEGRKQLASGKMKIEYVSFTDGSTYYKADVVSGSADATTRVYFEQCNLPQDQIAFEADDSGRLMPFKSSTGTQIKDGRIIEYSFDALSTTILTGSTQDMQLLKGTEFASTAESLLASGVDNYQKLYVIGTKDKIFEDDGFALSNTSVEFVMNNEKPISNKSQYVANVNHLESLYSDIRLSKVKNFKYLPPVNRIDDDNHRQLGHYKPWASRHSTGLSPKQLHFELAHYDQSGYSRSLSFEPTSHNNRLVGQFFAINHDTMNKLDIIDYGDYVYQGVKHHTFFVGKVVVDDNGSHTFIHLFTLVFG